MHNLYFPWFRILLVLGSLYGLYLVSGIFDPAPKDPGVREDDFLAYQEKKEEIYSQIAYIRNGEDRKYGNLIAIEPYFLPLDFYSEENFYNSLRPLLERAKKENAIDRKTLVVFPEHVGTGLVLLGAERKVFFSKDLDSAIQVLLQGVESSESSHPVESPESFSSGSISRKKEKEAISLRELFLLKSPEILRVYHNTFSRLATEFNVSILAGSLVVADPEIRNGEPVVGKEKRLYNAGFVYLGTGKAIQPVFRKVNLSEWEKQFLEPGLPRQDLIAKVPGWSVGVFLGEDSFDSRLYETIRDTKIDGIVSPASVFYGPKVAEETLGTEADRWIRESIGKNISLTRGKDYLQVFWRGDLGVAIPGGETYTCRFQENPVRGGRNPVPKILNSYF